jgi:hypothetical protein
MSWWSAGRCASLLLGVWFCFSGLLSWASRIWISCVLLLILREEIRDRGRRYTRLGGPAVSWPLRCVASHCGGQRHVVLIGERWCTGEREAGSPVQSPAWAVREAACCRCLREAWGLGSGTFACCQLLRGSWFAELVTKLSEGVDVKLALKLPLNN